MADHYFHGIFETTTGIFFENLRKKEYSRLDQSRRVYLYKNLTICIHFLISL
jgi:hypothetical protein